MKNNRPFLGEMIKNIAPRIGAKLTLEPKWGYVGQITFKNNKKRYFRASSIDINTLGASEISRDKDYTNFFLKKLGYNIVPKSKTFFSKKWGDTIKVYNRTIDDAYRYALSIKFPVVVKPNNSSQGNGVAVVNNKTEFYRAVSFIFKKSNIAIIEQKLSGKDYRVVVLDKKIISAYERIPLNITGNGKSTILSLIEEKQKQFNKSGRDTIINIKDPRIKEKLKSQKLTLSSIPKSGQKVFILDNANLSTGGDSKDITKTIHNDFKKIAINITRDMGLRLCGVDLMIDGSIEEKAKKWWVLEINSAPGLDHYANIGKTQKKIVEDMYLEILKGMAK